MKPTKPWGLVEFAKLHVSITEATQSKPPLPQTFTPWGAVLHTRLFTHTPRLCTGSASLPISHPHSAIYSITSTYILAHTSLSVHGLDQANPLTYRHCSVLVANPMPSKCRHLWSWCSTQTPQRWYNITLSSFMFSPFAPLLALLHANKYWTCVI